MLSAIATEMKALPRVARGAALALAGAVVVSTLMLRGELAHADSGGTCSSGASATASSYDGSSAGAASGDISADGYAADNCVGLAQTNAIFQAGLACESAGIPAGITSGLGYAVVMWYVVWTDGSQTIVTGPDAPQQYDCGDTFS
jgi:hypothetical protein